MTGRLAYPDPPLDDGVVRLRPWNALAPGTDAEALARAWADPEIRRWTAVPAAAAGLQARIEVAARWIAGAPARLAAGTSLDLAVVAAGEVGGTVLGEVGLAPVDWARREAAIGYWVAPEARGRGVATRAVRLLAGYARAGLGLTVVAQVDAANVASVRVATRAGVACRVRP